MKKSNGFLKKHFWLLLIIVISLFPLLPLLKPGMFVAHDAQDHVARIANFYQNLKEGTLIPRWAGNLNWGYGHPILMFLYPLPSYTASIFMFLGLPVVEATKLVFAIGFIGSGIAMFFWIRKMWGERAGFVAAIFYLFAPYRFVDLYVRGAIGENLFFIFPPLICYFLVKLFETKRLLYVALTALAVAGMILSHNALTIMLFPFIVLYGVLLVLKEHNKSKVAVYSVFSIVLGFGISAFFVIPAFFEGKYTLRDIVIKNEIFNRFETFSRLLYSPWSFGGSGDLSVQIGILHWLAVSGTFIILLIYFSKIQLKKYTTDTSFLVSLLAFIFFAVSIFLMLPLSEGVYLLVTVLQKFQFPWRFLSLSVFTSSVLAGYLAYTMKDRKKIILVLSFLAVLLTVTFWQPKGFNLKDSSFYMDIYESTTDTGESAPVWSVRFMEKRPAAAIQIVEGEGIVTPVSRTSTKHMYTVETISKETRILDNTLYFPGWNVFVDGEQVPTSEIMFHDPSYRGIINFYINSPGIHEITLQFTETKLRLMSNIISAISSIVVIGLFVYGKK